MPLVTIRIKGIIDKNWSDCFEGLKLTYQESDETILSGVVADQAAFYGLIGKLRDLGLQLVEVSSIEQSQSTKEGDY